MERVMIPDLDGGLSEAMRQIIASRELDDASGFLETKSYDEIALFSDESELEFIADRSWAEQNRILIVAAVKLLERLVSDTQLRPAVTSGTRYLMVSATDWRQADGVEWKTVDGTNGLLTPAIWCGNFEDPALRAVEPGPPATESSSFVADCVGWDPDYVLHEELSKMPGAPLTDRVFVRLRDLQPPWDTAREG